MKKLLRFLLICTLTIGLSACESNASNPQTTGECGCRHILGKYLCHGNYIGWSDHEPQREMVGAERRWDRDHISYRGSGRSGMEIGRGKLYDDHRWQDGRSWYTPGATNSRWK